MNSVVLTVFHFYSHTITKTKCSKFFNQSEQMKKWMRQELTSTAGFPAFMFCENFNKTNSLDLILSAPVLLLLVVHFVMAKQRWWWFEARVADPPLQCGLSETPPQLPHVVSL